MIGECNVAFHLVLVFLGAIRTVVVAWVLARRKINPRLLVWCRRSRCSTGKGQTPCSCPVPMSRLVRVKYVLLRYYVRVPPRGCFVGKVFQQDTDWVVHYFWLRYLFVVCVLRLLKQDVANIHFPHRICCSTKCKTGVAGLAVLTVAFHLQMALGRASSQVTVYVGRHIDPASMVYPGSHDRQFSPSSVTSVCDVGSPCGRVTSNFLHTTDQVHGIPCITRQAVLAMLL